MSALTPTVVDAQRVELMLSTPLVRPPSFREGVSVTDSVIDRNEIVVFDGPAGTGKTTTARYVAGRCARPCAVVTVPDRKSPLDLLRLIYLAVTGTQHAGTRYQMTNDLSRSLRAWAGVLVIDEMHLCGVDGLHTIVHLYEVTGRAFAVVMVGSGVSEVVDQYDNLATRVLATVDFEPLAGEDLYETLAGMDPRLAVTPRDVLSRHNDRACGGLLRRWVKTLTWLDILEAGPGPVDGDLLDEVAVLLRKKPRKDSR